MLPEPNFIDRDPETITREMVASWEEMTGKSLYPAQVERLQIDLQAYRETLVRIGIQEAAKQNLLAFASAPVLDYLGQWVDTERLPAQPARTTIRLTFVEAVPAAFQIPPGFRVETPSGIQFGTVAAIDVVAGQHSAEFTAEAIEAGSAGNGFIAGQVSTLVDDLPVEIDTVENLTVTRGGLEAEDDERYRTRIKLAPERFSWGSENRYRWIAMTAALELIDVQVVSPSPNGRLDIVLLSREGVPAPETVARVAAAFADSKARMLNDRIEVKAATPIDYALSVEVDVLASRAAELVLAQVRERLTSWAAGRALKLGRDLVPAQIKTALGGIDGLYDVRVLQPATKQVLTLTEWPRLTGLTVMLGRSVDDV